MTLHHSQPGGTASLTDPHLTFLPSPEEMYAASVRKDTAYEGTFIMAVRTTGIFCRPSCPARKPKPENVEFYRTAREALQNGYRPCKRCRPLEPFGRTPPEIAGLLRELDEQPMSRLRDADLRSRGLDPGRVRRWFKGNLGMTFQAYARLRRLGTALTRLGAGESVTSTAFDSGYESLSGFDEAVRQLTGRSASRNRSAVLVYLSRISTPLGPVLVATVDGGLVLLEFTDRPMLETQLQRLVKYLDCTFVPGGNDVTRQVQCELDEYFAGRLREFTVRLLTPGSEFQERVWTALTEIPYGETRTYAQQSEALGSPRSIRAVGRANGDNRISIVIPCHRVIGANGEMVGYGGGLWRKRWLLSHEGALMF